MTRAVYPMPNPAGVKPHGHKFLARVCLWKRWVHLGMFANEHDAMRAAQFARRLKAQRVFRGCVSDAEVRERFRKELVSRN